MTNYTIFVIACIFFVGAFFMMKSSSDEKKKKVSNSPTLKVVYAVETKLYDGTNESVIRYFWFESVSKIRHITVFKNSDWRNFWTEEITCEYDESKKTIKLPQYFLNKNTEFEVFFSEVVVQFKDVVNNEKFVGQTDRFVLEKHYQNRVKSKKKSENK